MEKNQFLVKIPGRGCSSKFGGTTRLGGGKIREFERRRGE